MKQNIGPVAIAIAVLVLAGLILVLWRVFLPQGSDGATPTKIPSQVQKNRQMIERFKAGDRTRPNSAP